MQVFCETIFRSLSKAKWIDCDPEDIENICKQLELSDNPYIRSFATKMRNCDCIILNAIQGDDGGDDE